MDINQYSVFLSLGMFLVIGIIIITMVGYIASPRLKERLLQVSYWDYIKLIGATATIATLGALVYQFGYGTPVCEYCWWQRIFIFPIEFVAFGTLMLRNKGNEMIIAALAVVGSLFAAMHYYFHVQAAILMKDVTLPCSSIGIIPSCTETPVLVFGFITIPLMALVMLIAILWMCYLAYRVRKQ